MEAVVQVCRYCGGGTKFVETPELPHYGKDVCTACGRFARWVSKPDAERVKRPAAHTDLVRKFSRGFCELCGRKEGDLPPRQVLEANHIVEYQDGGEPTRDNISIVCTRCHKMIHLLRTWC